MTVQATQQSSNENSSQQTFQTQIGREEVKLYATYDYLTGQIFWFLREIMGMTQSQVSDYCGYHILAHWVLKENGQAVVSITDIMEFCDLIGWTPIQFQTFMMICKDHVERGGVTISTVKNSQSLRANGYYRAHQDLMQKCIKSAAESVADHPEQLRWWTMLRAKTIN